LLAPGVAVQKSGDLPVSDRVHRRGVGRHASGSERLDFRRPACLELALDASADPCPVDRRRKGHPERHERNRLDRRLGALLPPAERTPREQRHLDGTLRTLPVQHG
jgi:hypothetical protein